MIDLRIVLTVFLLSEILLAGQSVAFAQDSKAQEKEEPTKKTTASDSVKKRGQPKMSRVEVIFVDGSVVRMAAQSTGLVVATKYGQLTVPLNEVHCWRTLFRIHLRKRSALFADYSKPSES